MSCYGSEMQPRSPLVAPLRTTVLLLLAACSDAGQRGTRDGAGNQTGGVVTYGAAYEGGQFHLGPVDWQESEWHNACAPDPMYTSSVRKAEGELLAGLWVGVPDVAQYCDACIYVETAAGKSAVLRVVTYGDTTANSIDVSPAAFAILDSGEYPRAMTWRFAKCPDTGGLIFEWKALASEWWSGFWVRNARVPLAKVEVKGAKDGASYQLQTRQSDGSLTDDNGFGNGAFTIRLTGVDGQVVEVPLAWPGAGLGGWSTESKLNFQ